MQLMVIPLAAWQKYSWSVITREFQSGRPYEQVAPELRPLQEIQKLAKYGSDDHPEPAISDCLSVPTPVKPT